MSNFIEVLNMQNVDILVNIDDISEIHPLPHGASIIRRNGDQIVTVASYNEVKDLVLGTEVFARSSTTQSHNVPKKVKCVETGAVYKSIHAAAEAFRVHQSAITHVISGKSKTCRGCHFELVGEL